MTPASIQTIGVTMFMLLFMFLVFGGWLIYRDENPRAGMCAIITLLYILVALFLFTAGL